jgi:tRNA pseudouridine55 synthase
VTGILLVDKPEGMSSAGVIRALKSRLGRTKVGHLGTLDPFASGLLPLCLGEATKVARYVLAREKAYTGTIRLGTATDTLDRTGTCVGGAPVPPLEQAAIARVATSFIGRQRQVPPMYSALKRQGVPLYKLARRGIEVERPAREIEIGELDLTLREPDLIDFSITCSKGTYVRVFAADVGQALGTVAHLERLRRTRVGSFALEQATPLDVLVALPADVLLPLVGVREALGHYAAFPAPLPDGLARLRRGQQDPLARLPEPRREGETALLIDPAGNVAAVIEAAGARPAWRLVRLLAGA